MSEQFRLFDPQGLTWVQRLWRGLSLEERRQVVSLLAEMAREALSRRRAMERKESTHES